MTTGYSTLTPEEVRKEIESIEKTAEKMRKSPQAAREVLIRAGILTADGKLAPRYRD